MIKYLKELRNASSQHDDLTLLTKGIMCGKMNSSDAAQFMKTVEGVDSLNIGKEAKLELYSKVIHEMKSFLNQDLTPSSKDTNQRLQEPLPTNSNIKNKYGMLKSKVPNDASRNLQHRKSNKREAKRLNKTKEEMKDYIENNKRIVREIEFSRIPKKSFYYPKNRKRSRIGALLGVSKENFDRSNIMSNVRRV